MKQIILILLFVLFSNLSSQNSAIYSKDITALELKEMLYTYASDDFLGREAGTKGSKIAVEYLRDRYIKLGIDAAKKDGDYFQYVPLKKEASPKVNFKVEKQSFDYYDDFISLSNGPSKLFTPKSYVFAGYGIRDNMYDDYKHIDVRGKLVVAVAGEPKSNNGKFIISGSKKNSKWSSDRQSFGLKQNLAKEMGAAAFILIDETLFKRYAPYYRNKNQIKTY